MPGAAPRSPPPHARWAARVRCSSPATQTSVGRGHGEELMLLILQTLCIFDNQMSHEHEHLRMCCLTSVAVRTTLVLTRGSATASYVPFITPYCSAMLSAVMTWVADSPLLRSQACACRQTWHVPCACAGTK